jgi:hypothetical protein
MYVRYIWKSSLWTNCGLTPCGASTGRASVSARMNENMRNKLNSSPTSPICQNCGPTAVILVYLLFVIFHFTTLKMMMEWEESFSIGNFFSKLSKLTSFFILGSKLWNIFSEKNLLIH